MKPTFFVFLVIFIFGLMLYVTRYTLYVSAQSITVAATVDEHLSWHREGNNLIVSTNIPEGFILYTNGERITKKGPVVLAVSVSNNFILTSGY